MNPFSGKTKRVVRMMLTLAALASLLVTAGCVFGGGGNGGGGGGGGGGNQGFTKASLKGQYAFTLRGIGTPDNLNSFYFVEGGVFTADGNGNITSGIDDFIENFTAFSDNITGIYSINSDGSGNVQFNFPGGGSAAVYRITLSDDSHFYMEEADPFGTSGGSGEKQDTTAFAAVPAGTFVLQTHDLLEGNSKVGVTTWTSGNITGTGDVLSGGALISPVTISGTAQAPGSATGRGLVTITDDTGTSDYVYYVVGSSKLRFLNADAVSSLGLGVAEKQTGPFSAASLSGTYVLGSAGETTHVAGIHTVGMFTTDGISQVTAGSFDFVQDGTPVTNVSLGSTPSSYTVGANGRAVVTLNLSTGMTNQKVMYLVSPSRAYFLVNDPINVEDGTLDKQTGSAFSNSSMKGQYALVMDGYDSNQQLPYRDRVGTWTPDGSGSVKTSYVASGYLPTVPPLEAATLNNLSGTYSVAANGRTTSSINNLSSNLILYLVSSNSGYMLQADNGVDIGGAITVQTGP